MSVKERPIRYSLHKDYLQGLSNEVIGGLSKKIKKKKLQPAKKLKLHQKVVKRMFHDVDQTFNKRKLKRHRWQNTRQRHQGRVTQEDKRAKREAVNSLLKHSGKVVVQHVFGDDADFDDILEELEIKINKRKGKKEDRKQKDEAIKDGIKDVIAQIPGAVRLQGSEQQKYVERKKQIDEYQKLVQQGANIKEGLKKKIQTFIQTNKKIDEKNNLREELKEEKNKPKTQINNIHQAQINQTNDKAQFNINQVGFKPIFETDAEDNNEPVILNNQPKRSFTNQFRPEVLKTLKQPLQGIQSPFLPKEEEKKQENKKPKSGENTLDQLYKKYTNSKSEADKQKYFQKFQSYKQKHKVTGEDIDKQLVEMFGTSTSQESLQYIEKLQNFRKDQKTQGSKTLKKYFIDLYNDIKESDDENLQDDSEIEGEGEHHKFSKYATTDVEIDEIMQNEPGYIGCVCIDELDDVLDQVKKHNMKQFNFIVNTMPSTAFQHHNSICGHWYAVYVDLEDQNEFCVYDSLGKNMVSEQIYDTFARYINKTVDHLVKFKMNNIREQAADSYACGWFAIRAIKMLNQGLPWKTVTGFDNVKENEKDVEDMERRYEKFGYI